MREEYAAMMAMLCEAPRPLLDVLHRFAREHARLLPKQTELGMNEHILPAVQLACEQYQAPPPTPEDWIDFQAGQRCRYKSDPTGVGVVRVLLDDLSVYTAPVVDLSASYQADQAAAQAERESRRPVLDWQTDPATGARFCRLDITTRRRRATLEGRYLHGPPVQISVAAVGDGWRLRVDLGVSGWWGLQGGIRSREDGVFVLSDGHEKMTLVMLPHVAAEAEELCRQLQAWLQATSAADEAAPGL